MKARPNLEVQVVEALRPGDVVQILNVKKPLNKNGTKRVMALEDLAAPVGTVPVVYATGPEQGISGTGDLGAIDLASALTIVSTTGVATAQLAAATIKGLTKTIRMKTYVGDLTITVAGDNITEIIMSGAGQFVVVSWTGTGWAAVDNFGTAIT
jgi:hypothetical protein